MVSDNVHIPVFRKFTNYATYDIVYGCVTIDGQYAGSMCIYVDNKLTRKPRNLQFTLNHPRL